MFSSFPRRRDCEDRDVEANIGCTVAGGPKGELQEPIFIDGMDPCLRRGDARNRSMAPLAFHADLRADLRVDLRALFARVRRRLAVFACCESARRDADEVGSRLSALRRALRRRGEDALVRRSPCPAS